jgi:transcriptional regulator with XRE-family HTH domain
MLREYIGKRIAELRKERELSQVDLALKAGLDKGHIARIELGRYSVGLDTLQKIADALDVKIDLIEK